MRTKTHKCPSCEKKLNAATCISSGKRKPEAGDVTVCAGCACLLRFSRSLRVRLLTAEEIDKLPKALLTTLRKTQRAIQQLGVAQRISHIQSTERSTAQTKV